MINKNKTVIALAVTVVVIVLCFVSFYKSREKTRRISCYSNLHAMGLALKQYAQDYGNYLPDKNGAEGLELLRAYNYLSDYKVYLCPSTGTTMPPGSNGPLEYKYVDYIYRGGKSMDDRSDSAILWDKPTNHSNYGNILFLDGHVEGRYGQDWTRHIR